MATLVGTVTEDFRKYIAMFNGRLLGISETVTNTVTPAWNPLPVFFRIGEGGYALPGPTVRTPDPTLRRLDNNIQDLDVIVDPTRPLIDQRYASDSLFYFEKDLEDGDFVFSGTSTIEITCFLDNGDANDDGFGNDPEFGELAIYSEHPTEAGEYLMLYYCTFPLQIKNSGLQLQNVVKVTF